MSPRHNDRWLVNRSAINGRLAALFNAAAAIAVAGGAAAAGAYTCFGDSIYVRHRGGTETVVAQVLKYKGWRTELTTRF